MQMAWAPKTLRMYEVGMNCFRKFRVDYNCQDINAPANPLEITRFISYLSLQNKASTTISTYVSAISTWHKSLRLPDPCNDFIVKKSLKGGFKTPSPKELREPITIELPGKLVAALGPVSDSIYEQKMFKAAYLLAFFGLFRIGEFVADTKERAQRSVLLLSDISIQGTSLKVTIRFSKTDQKGLSSGLTLKGQNGNPLCPVGAVREFMISRGQRAGPLFMHFNGTFLSRFQFNSMLASTIRFLEPQQRNIKAHSFRIGGATNAMCKGIPYSKIQEMGRWQSHAAKRYIRHVDIDVAALT